MTLGGRLGGPEIAASVQGRGLAGTQMSVAAVDATVSGQPLRSRLVFSARAPTATLADQPLSDVQASGRLAENLVHIDTLSAGQTEGPGSLAAAGNYDLRSERYDVTLDVMRWNVVAATDQPFEGQVGATFRGAGSGASHVGMVRCVLGARRGAAPRLAAWLPKFNSTDSWRASPRARRTSTPRLRGARA